MIKKKTEHEKYAGFGATVLFTGIYSGLSGSYALYRVFAFYYISIPGGFLWFLIMFNLTRLFMLSIRNNEEDSSSKDNKEDNSSEIESREIYNIEVDTNTKILEKNRENCIQINFNFAFLPSVS